MLSDSASELASLGLNNNIKLLDELLSSVSKDEIENYRKHVLEDIQKQINNDNLFIRDSTIEMLKRWLSYVEDKKNNPITTSNMGKVAS